MLDIKFVRENLSVVKKGLLKKGADVDLEGLLRMDEERRQLIVKTDELRSAQNKASKIIPKLEGAEKEKALEEMKGVASTLKELEPKLTEIETQIYEAMLTLPNPAHETVPEGIDECENVTEQVIGEVPKFDFKVKDHVDLGTDLDLIDIERAAKVSGARFDYKKNKLVFLEFALIRYAMDILTGRGFVAMLPPVLVKEKAMYGTGFLPADESQIYKTEKDDLYLVGTAEVPLAAYHYNELIPEEKLPLRYAGFSTCFRREAGAYGKDTRGMFRVHQFDKVEMFSFSHPEKSWEEHDHLVETQEEIMKGLELSYRKVNICGGDLGAPAAKKYDLEAWLPGQNQYREMTSCSNCTDFQARRLNVRMKPESGSNVILHTLNGTAIALGRTLIAIMENYQQADGSIKVPDVLTCYTGFKEIKNETTGS